MRHDETAFDELVFYKLGDHGDIHLKAGEILNKRYDFPYPPKTFRSIFTESYERSGEKGIRAAVSCFPFPDEVKASIYAAEIEAEIKESVAYKGIDASEALVIKPKYLSIEETKEVLEGKGISFKDVVKGSEKDDKGLSDHFDIYSFEKYMFGNSVDEIKSLRILAAKGSEKEHTEEERFFFSLGASGIGPVYALYAEWIISFCKKHGIKKLLPLMREATMLKMCLDKLGDIPSAPLYVSRRALFNSSITYDDFDKKMEQVLIKTKASPKVLCNDLCIDPAYFAAYRTMGDLYKAGKKEEFKAYLYTMKREILQKSRLQRRYFLKHLNSVIGSLKSATVDIGFSGTSEGLIREILKKEGLDKDISHLVLMGADGKQTGNILDGLDIYSWLGMAGENTDNTKRLMYHIQVIEALINDTCGTTLGYDIHGPLLDKDMPPQLKLNDIKAKACQRGMEAFADLWKEYRDEYDVDALLKNKEGFINMWRRFLEAPTREEAMYAGDIFLYDNYTLDKKVYRVRDDRPVEDPDLYLDGLSREKSDYPQANVVLQYPDYYKKKLILIKEQVPGLRRMMDIIDVLKGKEHIAIFAAGQRGRDIQRIASMLGVDIQCFIDSDISLQGKTIGGIPVISIEDAKDIRYFINASYNYPGEVRETIIKHYPALAGSIFGF